MIYAMRPTLIAAGCILSRIRAREWLSASLTRILFGLVDGFAMNVGRRRVNEWAGCIAPDLGFSAMPAFGWKVAR